MRLEIKNISFSYDGSRNIFENLSLIYDSPEVMCILGANGTGKSTLLKCIIDENNVGSGEIILDNKPVNSYDAMTLARKIAYIPQTHVPNFPFKVIDVVVMGRTSRMGYLANPGNKELEIAMDNLKFLKIEHLANKAYTDISGGERQLVMIASALTQEPELMILDEPTAHLDFGNQYRFVALVEKLKEKHIGVMMTTHFPDHALQLECTTAILHKKSISKIGLASEVITDENMSNIYGIDVSVEKIGNRSFCIPGKHDFD